jgi:hypothetical protein
MKRIYEHAISLSSNECVFLNTSLGRKYHPILEDDNGDDVGTWKSNHKGPNVDTNKWLSCDKGEAFENTSVEERPSHSSNQRANQELLNSKGCVASS